MKLRRRLFWIIFAMFPIILPGGCATLYSMSPDEQATNDLQLVESGESFILAGTVAFRPANRQNRVILGHGRYIKVMTSPRGDFYLSTPRNIILTQANGLPEFRSGGIYVPHDDSRLCLVFWMQARSSGSNSGGVPGRTGHHTFADTHAITFYTWIKRPITAIPLCNN